MTLLERIADAAAVVRLRQCGYFRTRSQEALSASKAAERHLDDLLAERAAESCGERQGRLFE